MANVTDPIETEVTSIQAGMIFHALAHPGMGVDIEHVSMSLDESLDIAKFKAAWEKISLKHDVSQIVGGTAK